MKIILFPLLIGLAWSCVVCAADDEMELRQFYCNQASVTDLFRAVTKTTKVMIRLQAPNEFKRALPRFTMAFDRIPVSAVLLLICADAGLEYQVEDGVVIFYPRGTLKKAAASVKAKRTSTPGMSMTVGTTSWYPVNYRPPTMSVSNGVVVITGPMPIFQKRTSGIQVDTRQFDLKEKDQTSTPPPALPPPPVDDPEMTRQLARMPLPALNLRNLTMEQVLNQLRMISRKLTADHSAVNLYVSALAAQQPTRLTVALTPGSMLDAIRTLSTATGLRYRIETWGVAFY